MGRKKIDETQKGEKRVREREKGEKRAVWVMRHAAGV